MRGPLAALAAAGSLLVAASPAGAQAAPVVSTSPVPGMRTATTRTQISLRGAPIEALGSISVTGSRSGPHRGTLRAHSDAHGASFVPARPFSPGERVTVRTNLAIQGAHGGDFAFTVARRPPLSRTRPAELPGIGRGAVQRYVTRPDLAPPAATVTTRRDGRSSGLVFLGAKSGRGQDGPMIIDDAGRLVWFKPIRDRELATDFRVQTYRGKPALTWWQGRLVGGDGRGEGVIYDEHYKPVRRVRAGNGLSADLHEFQLTPNGTALLVIYDSVRRDLSAFGGPRNGIVSEAVVQEVDIETGLVMFEWHSLDDVALAESYTPAPKGQGHWDYMHVNSVALDAANDLVISSRHTRAVYRVSRTTGRIVWRLGGRRSDFTMGPGTRFAWQHDAQPQPDGTLTLYDNGSSPPVHEHSRAITLALDTQRHTATLKQALVHPRGLLSATQGSVQRLPGGNTFVGWGSQRWFTEFDADGNVVFDGHLARGNDSYRAYRFEWEGHPATAPKAIASRRAGRVSARVSWNGATAVARWQLLAGPSRNALTPLTTAVASGFETFVAADTAQPWISVRALDASGATLGESPPIEPAS